MAEEGKQLMQCLNVISAYGKEINALCEALNDQLSQEVSDAQLPWIVDGKLIYEYRLDESGWIYTDFLYALPLKRKKARNVGMYLGYQISLTGDGISYRENEEPLLHMFLWSGKPSLSDGRYYYMYYPQELPYSLEDNRLIVWADESRDDRKNNEWTFSIRLLTLDSPKALIDRVINPAIELMRGKTAIDALPDDLPGLVLYKDESDLDFNRESAEQE